MTVFATVIAITKDLPDVEGDRRYNIDTLATRFGPRAIAFAGAVPVAVVLQNLGRPRQSSTKHALLGSVIACDGMLRQGRAAGLMN